MENFQRLREDAVVAVDYFTKWAEAMPLATSADKKGKKKVELVFIVETREHASYVLYEVAQRIQDAPSCWGCTLYESMGGYE